MPTSLGNALNKLDALSAPLNRLDRDDQRRNIELLRDGIAELIAERDALQASLDALHGMKFSDRNYHALKSRAEAAEAKLAELQQDAARYRWLRDDSKWLGVNAGYNEIYMCDLDTVIDAELAQPKPDASFAAVTLNRGSEPGHFYWATTASLSDMPIGRYVYEAAPPPAEEDKP